MSSQTHQIEESRTMQDTAEDFLVEIGLEELPPKNLANFAGHFAQNLEKYCKNLQLTFSGIETFIAPRRLAALIKNLRSVQPDQVVVKRGPAKAAAFDKEGKPTQAALGFAASCQTTLDKIGFLETEKGPVLFFEQTVTGQKTADLIPKIVQDALINLPIAKRMRWGDRQETFVRPVHWVVLLFGNTVIQAEFFGIQSSGATRGHRFHHPADISLTQASDYETELFSKGKVIAVHSKRRQFIEEKLIQTATSLKASAVIDTELLDLVTGLVEWPVILFGQFSENFLKLPKEVLISAMQVHQKCFPLVDEQGKLLPKFLIVSNIESRDPNIVIQGNERVMQARLSDAAFFYEEDKKISLDERRKWLKEIIFQQGLGTLWDKTQRIALLSDFICSKVSQSEDSYCRRAAELCKSDLTTQMVLEFPELQGIMGQYYLQEQLQEETKKKQAASKECREDVQEAIAEHYQPRFAQDTLPNSLFGRILAIADRIDSLVGLFALGKRPTGDKDPYALRRQALAVWRIILEHSEAESQYPIIDLVDLFNKSREAYDSTVDCKKWLPVVEANSILLDFFFERARAWYQEKGIPAQVFEAVLAKQPTKPKDFHDRLQAVTAFLKLPEAESLSAANKRVRNILEKNIESLPSDTNLEVSLLQEVAEQQLAQILGNKEAEVGPLLQAGNYTAALKALATLKEPIDAFFDSVMVMVESVDLRNNRLKLLQRLRQLFLEIADISLL